MIKYGLKLWSTNKQYMEPAILLYRDRIYDYIELYVVPGSLENYSRLWQELDIPYVIHAPHFLGGLNFAKSESRTKNMALAVEAQKYADDLSAEKIIFHPGTDGDIGETARQMRALAEPRALVENKPYHAIGSELICNGTTPEEIAFVIKEAGVGFCFDIGHAVCSAKAHGMEYLGYLRRFVDLKPALFHLTDGDTNNVYDEHRHIGQGNYDLENILKMIPAGALITVETDKDSKNNLNDFIIDIERLKDNDKDRQ